MANANELATRILTAGGPEGFPARIGKRTETFADLARLRFLANRALLPLCQTLNASTDDTQNVEGDGRFTSNDATIIGFFLATNKSIILLRCA